MNKKQLKRGIHSRVRLRPAARSVLPGYYLPQRDDTWIVDKSPRKECVRLRNITTDHFTDLAFKDIHHFDANPAGRNDGLRYGVLRLTVQISMSGPRLWTEPYPRPTYRGG